MAPTCTGRETDSVYAEASGYGATVMGRVLVPRKRLFDFKVPFEVECDTCQHVSRTRLCPHCHFELSHDIGQIDQRIIAIIGGRATGKTHYIASLITRLQHDTGKNFDLAVRMLGDKTQERWERDFYVPLFVHKTVLQPNRPAEIDPEVKSPLIFRLTLNSEKNSRRALNISFFDSAGEDMTSLTTMSIQNRYITQADGIVFLLDPLQIPYIRQQLPAANMPPADRKASPEYIVGRLRDLFEREHKLRPMQKVKVPIAFTLSKMDTLFHLLEPGSEFHHPGQHYGYLDFDDVQSVHTEAANYLRTWINANFCNVIHDNFACYNYFGVSSLGEQPDTSNRLTAVSPLRVEDPFLWILYQLGLVKGKKRG
ncbi:MAG: hypothetical protein JOZ18_01425 [Chloroflexi bacterium]|nr:hypothetical protein [Chloroflexota bacterium]